MGYIGSKPANKPITSADIEDGIVIAADIADDAITLAKMASGTDGNVISYDASGNPVAIATGSDGEVLTSAGAGQPPAFEAVSAGTALTGSTNNTIPTVTGANAISGEANLTFDGTDLKVSTGNLNISTTGKGIDFDSSSTSAILDDYEEGTWTPTWGSESGDLTSTSSSYGNYTKIGNYVSLRFGTTFDSGTASNYYKLMNAPFTSTTNSIGGVAESSVGHFMKCWWDSGGTQIYINKYDNTFLADAIIKCEITMKV